MQNDVPGAIEPDEMEVVLADVDADPRHLVCRFAGHGSCSFCLLIQNLRMRPGARSVHPISGHQRVGLIFPIGMMRQNGMLSVMSAMCGYVALCKNRLG